MFSRDTWLLIIFGAFLIYAIVGAVVIRLWTGCRRVRRPVSVSADPAGALAYWPLLLIHVEAFSLSSLSFSAGLLLVARPADMGYTLMAIAIMLVFLACFYVVVDIVWVRRVQLLARQRSASAGV
jgi:hypothetical protein